MGKTYTYNSGTCEAPSGLFLGSYGVFFDGTGNNLRNTEIRKKVEGVEEYAQVKPSDDEQKIFKKKAQSKKERKFWFNRRANSFMNDFSNVARMKLCCTNAYAIYVEGIGTENENKDKNIGLALGTGSAGVREKVRKGCEALADKIISAYNLYVSDEDFSNLVIDVDAFGFSRGAAAARNFIYEIQKTSERPRTVNAHGYSATMDSDGHPVTKPLKNGNLPPFGRLGTALLEKGMGEEELLNMVLNLRFLGLYDTVASHGIIHSNDSKDLNLNDLGSYNENATELGACNQVVHFVAMDEQRKNFSLTKTRVGLTYNFPGVHSDIGGGYNNGPEEIDQLEVHIENDHSSLYNDPLEAYKRELIIEGWFKEAELPISKPFFSSKKRMDAKRKYVGKEYSYILLHFMENFLRRYAGSEPFVLATAAKYPIEGKTYLPEAKQRLLKYINGEASEWKLFRHPKIEAAPPKYSWTQTSRDQQNYNQMKKSSFESELKDINSFGDNELLRNIRHDYLHWSATKAGIGMGPAKNRQRIIY